MLNCEAASFLILEEEAKTRKSKRQWVRKWIQCRREDGCCVKLLLELRSETPDFYKNFLRNDHIVSIPLFQRQ